MGIKWQRFAGQCAGTLTDEIDDWNVPMVKIEDYRRDDRPVVPPVLIYADLLRTVDDINLETAEILHDDCIARLVE